MASKFFNLTIDFYREKDQQFNFAVRKREAPEDYKISEEEVREIIKQEFHGEKEHRKFLFKTEKSCKDSFNRSPKRIVINANFNEFHKTDSQNQVPAIAQQASN